MRGKAPEEITIDILIYAVFYNSIMDTENKGGTDGKEQQPTLEQKTYLPEQKLTDREKRFEGENLIKGFTDILKTDPDVQKSLIEGYFKYDFTREASGRHGTISFKKGTGDYNLNTINLSDGTDPFFISRTENGIMETLNIDRGWGHENGSFTQKPRLEYSVINKNEHNGLGLETGADRRAKDSGQNVIKGRELLTKVQKDFGKIQSPAPTPQ